MVHSTPVSLTLFTNAVSIRVQTWIFSAARSRPRAFPSMFSKSLFLAASTTNLKMIQCKKIKWASSWDYATYRIGDQRRLRRACASAQSRQSLRCSHTWTTKLDEGSESSPTVRLCMRIWRMNLRRTKSAKISWVGSNGPRENLSSDLDVCEQ